MNTLLNAPILNFEFDFILSEHSPAEEMIKEIERRLDWTNGSCSHFSLNLNFYHPDDNKPDFRVKSILGRADIYYDDESGGSTKVTNNTGKSPVRCFPVVRSKSFCRNVVPETSSANAPSAITPLAKAPVERIKIVDLHGMDKSTALEVTLNGLSEAISENYTKLVIIHGKGLGRLKCSVHNLLKQLYFIKSYRLDTRNEGRTVVIF